MTGKAIAKKEDDKQPLNKNKRDRNDDPPAIEFPGCVGTVDHLAAFRQLAIVVSPPFHLAAIKSIGLHGVLHRCDGFGALALLYSLDQLRGRCTDLLEVNQ